jgi:hypothetical protein
MQRRQVMAALLACVATAVLAQKKEAAPAPKKEAAAAKTFELAGTLADAKGPLAGKIVRVGPVDAQGNMLAIRNLGGGQGAEGQSVTDAQGRFTIVVGRSFFRNQDGDSIGIRASTDIGGGRMSTAHGVAVVKFDSRKDKVDLGRIVLETLKAR